MGENENLNVVKDTYLAYRDLDIPALLNCLTDDVMWFSIGPPGDHSDRRNMVRSQSSRALLRNFARHGRSSKLQPGRVHCGGRQSSSVGPFTTQREVNR